MDEATIKTHIDHIKNIKNALSMPQEEGGMAAAQHGLELLGEFLINQKRIANALVLLAETVEEANPGYTFAAIRTRGM